MKGKDYFVRGRLMRVNIKGRLIKISGSSDLAKKIQKRIDRKLKIKKIWNL